MKFREKIAITLGSLAALKPDIINALAWNPALTSSLLGAGVGAAVAGEDRRAVGALAGGLGGLGAGLTGAGLLTGIAHKRIPFKPLVDVAGDNPDVHQHLGAAVGGLLGGALVQPKPVPVILSTQRDEGGGSRFADLVNVARQKVDDLSSNMEPTRV